MSGSVFWRAMWDKNLFAGSTDSRILWNHLYSTGFSCDETQCSNVSFSTQQLWNVVKNKGRTKLNLEPWCSANVSPYLSQRVQVVKQNAFLISCASYLISPHPHQLRNWSLLLQMPLFSESDLYGPVKRKSCPFQTNRGHMLLVLIDLRGRVSVWPCTVHYTEFAWYYGGTEFPHGNYCWEPY